MGQHAESTFGKFHKKGTFDKNVPRLLLSGSTKKSTETFDSRDILNFELLVGDGNLL